MAFAFEKRVVSPKSIDFTHRTCQLTEQFTRIQGFLADQLNRAALSIAANIAEGSGHFTRLGSPEDRLRNASRCGNWHGDDVHCDMRDRLEETARILSGLNNGLQNRES